MYPTPAPGIVPRSWLLPRTATAGTLIGTFCAITKSTTLSTLRPLFLGQALRYGLPDFDSAALRLAKPRALTQTVSSFLYATTIRGEAAFDGVQFQSRYGDELTLIAIFERGTDHDHPTGILTTRHAELGPDHPNLTKAMAIIHLRTAPPTTVPNPSQPIASRRPRILTSSCRHPHRAWNPSQTRNRLLRRRAVWTHHMVSNRLHD